MNDAAEAWTRSGLARLTGRADGPPLHGPSGLLAVAERWAAELAEAVAPAAPPVPPGTAADVLAQRAAHAPLTRRGPVSPGGACHLLAAADGVVAVNLPRPDDVDLLPAWLGLPAAPADDGPDWPAIAAAVATRPAGALVEDGQRLGLAVALVPADGSATDEALEARGTAERGAVPVVTRLGPAAEAGRSMEGALVVDLSSLWAGPLCAHLLGRAGARVVKVESTERPDGARRGPASFYDLLHAGHEAVAVPFTSERGRRQLRDLLAAADVVIEGSRPRALAQLGIDPAAVVGARPGVTWVAVTAYGRTGPWSDRVGFGDDAAAAGGLLLVDDGGPVLCADAVADPLAGLAAAAGAAAAHRGGGGVLVDVALREVARVAAPLGPEPARPCWGPVGTAHPQVPTGAASPLGADTDRVFAELGLAGAGPVEDPK